jgi:hypothetical protein
MALYHAEIRSHIFYKKLRWVTELDVVTAFLYPLLLISETLHIRLWFILTNISKGLSASIFVAKNEGSSFLRQFSKFLPQDAVSQLRSPYSSSKIRI